MRKLFTTLSTVVLTLCALASGIAATPEIAVSTDASSPPQILLAPVLAPAWEAPATYSYTQGSAPRIVRVAGNIAVSAGDSAQVDIDFFGVPDCQASYHNLLAPPEARNSMRTTLFNFAPSDTEPCDGRYSIRFGDVGPGVPGPYRDYIVFHVRIRNSHGEVSRQISIEILYID